MQYLFQLFTNATVPIMHLCHSLLLWTYSYKTCSYNIQISWIWEFVAAGLFKGLHLHASLPLHDYIIHFKPFSFSCFVPIILFMSMGGDLFPGKWELFGVTSMHTFYITRNSWWVPRTGMVGVAHVPTSRNNHIQTLKYWDCCQPTLLASISGNPLTLIKFFPSNSLHW